MCKIIFTFLSIGFLIINIHTTGFNQTIEWDKSLGGSNTDFANWVVPTNDGNFVVGGSTLSNDQDVVGNHGEYDWWLIKINPTGQKIWQKCIGGTSGETLANVKKCSNGGFICVGNTRSNGQKQTSEVYGNKGDQDVFVVKVDEQGNIIWNKTLGGCALDESRSIVETSDSGFIFFGGTFSNSGDAYGYNGDWDAWMVKLNSAGELIWQKTIGGGLIDYFFSGEVDGTGNIYAAGLTSSFDGDLSNTIGKGQQDFWISKFTSEGDLIWQKRFGGSQKDEIRAMEVTSDGGAVLFGNTESFDGDITNYQGGLDFWVVRINSEGDMLWQKSLGGTGNDSAFDVIVRSDSKFILIGQTSSFNGDVINNHGSEDAWIVKIDDQGNTSSPICYGGSNNDFARCAIPLNGSDLLVVGGAESSDFDVSQNLGDRDVWVFKTSIPLGLQNPFIEDVFIAITPNPTDGIFNLSTNLTGEKIVSIYDSKGVLIKDLQMKDFLLQIDLGNVPKSIYTVQIRNDQGFTKGARLLNR